MGTLEICLRIFFIAINRIFLMKMNFTSPSMHLKRFADLCLLCEAAELKETG